MHIPQYFAIKDRNIIESFINENSFATIVSASDSYPLATHIPIELELNSEGEKVLWGHVSKSNPQWEYFTNNNKVLVIYLSPIHSYVSSSWYAQDNVSTWNYMSVQVQGSITLMDNDTLLQHLERLTNKYEKQMEKPHTIDKMSTQTLKQINGIIGFEIRIDNMECAFKLSQNRSEQDFKNILHELRNQGGISKSLAEIMSLYKS